jgi:hypothetical protein
MFGQMLRISYNRFAKSAGERSISLTDRTVFALQVVELMVQYNELKDWQKALELVVPTRKRAGEEQDRPGTRPRVETGEGTDRQEEEPAAIEGEIGRQRERLREGREDEGDGEMPCSVEKKGLESVCEAAQGVMQEKRPGGENRKEKETNEQVKGLAEITENKGEGGLEGLKMERADENGKSNEVIQKRCSLGGESLEGVHGDEKDPKELDRT